MKWFRVFAFTAASVLLILTMLSAINYMNTYYSAKSLESSFFCGGCFV